MTAVGTCAVSAFLADASPAGCRMLWRHLRGDVKVSPARCHLSVALLHLRGVALCVVTCVVMTAVGTCAVSAFLADASPAWCCSS